ncbi:MAG: hypothetical protein IH868_06795 [Chloroflexi bacterium]|nr:hypothetical protein [Chloroflexota bacterium]
MAMSLIAGSRNRLLRFFELENWDPSGWAGVITASNSLVPLRQITHMHPDMKTMRPGRGLFLVVASVILVAIACGSSTPVQGPEASQSAPASASLNCVLSGPASGFALQAVPGVDPVPTAFDGVNTATCSFSEPVESVTVRLFTVGGPLDGFEVHVETIAVRPPSTTVVFPLEFGGERQILSSLLPLGPYRRSMEARMVGGAGLVIQTEAFEASTEIFLVDPPNATAFAPFSIGTARTP